METVASWHGEVNYKRYQSLSGLLVGRSDGVGGWADERGEGRGSIVGLGSPDSQLPPRGTLARAHEPSSAQLQLAHSISRNHPTVSSSPPPPPPRPPIPGQLTLSPAPLPQYRKLKDLAMIALAHGLGPRYIAATFFSFFRFF